jgi:protein-S-isoprenylcysteine O-methyltransferase Ste14
MDYIGKSPVSVPVLILGKVAFLTCSLFFLVKTFALDTMLFDSILTQTLGVIFYAIGLLTLIVSLLQLGQSTAVGIPERDTELKTHGMYRLTRNPIYLGAFIMCAGSCFYSIHLINVLLFAIAVAIHVRIVAKEEQFLEKRFGKQWLEYKQQVPRFVGISRRSDSHRNSA